MHPFRNERRTGTDATSMVLAQVVAQSFPHNVLWEPWLVTEIYEVGMYELDGHQGEYLHCRLNIHQYLNETHIHSVRL